jgi:peptidyl-prolyl cis-trans isomerase B (cyclophilin B)
MKKIIALILLLSLLTPCLSSCGNPLRKYTEDTSTEAKDYYYVAMAVKKHGVIIVKLDAVNAPITTANFVKLVREGFYDGLTFHRVINNFMIQGGDPEGTGLGGAPNKIIGEFTQNGIYNPIMHERGTISMARNSVSMDSASSQFFICNSSSASVSNLNGSYAAFGHVVEGMDVVDSITESTVKYGDSNGTIRDFSKQAVITKMMVIEYKEAN